MRGGATTGLVLLAVGIVACAGLGPEPAAVIDAMLPEGRHTEALAKLAASQELAPAEDFRVVGVGRDAHTSHHLVWIRDREALHRHDRHDLVVVMLRGHGGMTLAGAERPVGPGSILYVPRGTPHAFRNGAREPAVAYAIYAPAFDGEDRVPVDPAAGAPGAKTP